METIQKSTELPISCKTPEISTAKQIEILTVQMYHTFLHGIKKENVENIIDRYLDLCKLLDEQQLYSNIERLIKWMFLVRDCRGKYGRGSRDIFKWIFLKIYDSFPNIAISLIKFISQFGYWKDVISLLEQDIDNKLKNSLVNVIVKQHEKDLHYFHIGDIINMSLLVKYLPKESGKNKILARYLAYKIYHKPSDHCSDKTYYIKYRKDNAKMNKKIKTVEIDMCNSSFDKIDYSTVPSKAMNKYSQAFANRIGNEQRSSETNRIVGSEKYNKFINNDTEYENILPHEIGFRLLYCDLSLEEIELYHNKLNGWINKLVDIMTTENDNSESLLKLVNFTEVSRFMSNYQKSIIITMSYIFSKAIAIAEQKKYGNIIWGNRFIVFSMKPEWFILNDDDDHHTSLNKMNQSINMTGSDFVKAHELILSRAKEMELEQDKMPKSFITWTITIEKNSHIFSGKNGWDSYPLIIKSLEKSQIDNIIKKEKIPCVNFEQDFTTYHEILENAYLYYDYKLPSQYYWDISVKMIPEITRPYDIDIVNILGFSNFNIKFLFETHSFYNSSYDILNIMLSDRRYKCISDELITTIPYISSPSDYEKQLQETDIVWKVVEINI